MKVVIAYEGQSNFNVADQKIIDFYSVCGSPADEIELDTFSDIYELSQELGRTLEVGSFVHRDGEKIPRVNIMNEEEAE